MKKEQDPDPRDEQVAQLAAKLVQYYAWYFEASKEADEIRQMNLIKMAIKAEIFAAETRGVLEGVSIVTKAITTINEINEK